MRHPRVRANIVGTKERPRLSVFRSNRYIYAQLVDDGAAKTIASASDMKLKGKALDRAKEVGSTIAKLAKEKKLTSIVFDRGGFRYAGRIKVLADAAREGGLKF